MLPDKAGSLELTEDSRRKLDLFYRRFCTGEYGSMYGLSHIVYACHASFPLLISPELANLTWLNFSTYTSGKKLRQIDRIVVSDFLLSSLVRPISNKQCEVIPEIRNYLLYLLKDSKWFGLFGIEHFGDERLNSLAQFLRRYLSDKRSNRENNSSGFKEINEWAALAYLEPEVLAMKMAEAYQNTFPKNKTKSVNELGQLRLNMLIDRFDQQINVQKISSGTGDNKMFIKLHNYSLVNKAKLFKRDEELSMRNDDLVKSYSGESDSKVLIQLPVEKKVGDRLNRKKNKIQRIFALFVAMDDYQDSSIPNIDGCVEGAYTFSGVINGIAEKNKLEIVSEIWVNEHAVTGEIVHQLSIYGSKAEKEDIILIYFSGHFIRTGKESFFAGYDTALTDNIGGTINAISPKQILQLTKGNKVILVLDGVVDPFAWSKGIEVLISAVRNHTGEIPIADFPERANHINALPYYLSESLAYNGAQITYNDLKKVVRMVKNEAKTPIAYLDQRPLFIAGTGTMNNYFLSNNIVNATPGMVLIYNKGIDTWQVLDDDFQIVQVNRANKVYEYITGEEIPDIKGEIYIRDHIIRFDGLTERLNPNLIYKVKPANPSLYYSVVANTISKQLDILSEVDEILSGFKHGEYSRWGQMERQRPQDETSAQYLDKIYDTRLQIYILNTEEPMQYQLEFIDYGNGNSGSTRRTQWTITGKDLLSKAIEKFVRYDFLENISLPPENDLGYSSFNLEINYWLSSKDKEQKLSTQENGLLLTANMISFDNGEIYFSPYYIEIISKESFPIFFDAYILTSDLEIRKIFPGKNNIIEPGKSAEMLFGDTDIIEQMLMEEITGQLKFLFSKDPVTVDFSQSAVNKI